MARPAIGPNGIALMQHVLSVLEGHPAGVAAKLEAFGMLNGITAAFALQEQSDPALQQRNAAYLAHAITSGERPRLAELLSREPQQPAPDEQVADRYPDIMARILTALLGPRVLRPRCRRRCPQKCTRCRRCIPVGHVLK